MLVTQLCPTLYDPMDGSPAGSSVHEILQARILEWIAIPFSRGSFCPSDETQVSCTAGRFLIFWATMEAPTHTVEFCFILVARASVDLVYYYSYYYSEYSVYSDLWWGYLHWQAGDINEWNRHGDSSLVLLVTVILCPRQKKGPFQCHA